MRLSILPWLRSGGLALALWLISGDALSQRVDAQWQAQRPGRPIERLPSWLQDVLRTVPQARHLLADIQRIDEILDRIPLELFLGAQDLDEARRAEDMASGHPVHVSYGVLTERRRGRRFVVAMLEHASTCGSAGCSFLFLMQRSGRWQFAGNGFGDGVSFVGQSARGFPVFVLESRGDACPYRWDGARFWHSSGCRDW